MNILEEIKAGQGRKLKLKAGHAEGLRSGQNRSQPGREVVHGRIQWNETRNPVD